ncbi:MAG: GmrSD restriction endonuclease domain-containing protein [Pseudomonas sp.]
MSTFDSTKVALPDMIRDITAGKVQLPDFQRGWVWDDSHVRSLLVSVARSFPVGAVMLLDTGGEVRFQVRPIENVDFPAGIPEPEKLILDGQQRLTSLTQVLALNKPVKTFDEKGKRIDRYYYIDINRALEAEQLEDTIIAVEQSRQLKTNFGRDVALDLSTLQLECEQLYFPCNQILNSDAWEESLQEYAPQHFGTYMQFRKRILNAFRSYQLPVIALGKTTSKEAVCLVFEKVNTGGVPLSVFELITATFAADNFNLRDDWYGSELRKVPGRRSRLAAEPLLKAIEPTDFLQAVSLLNSYERRQADIAAGKLGKSAAGVSAKRVALLSLKLNEYQRWTDIVEQGYKRAAQFLRKECFFTVRDMPYRTQIVPLAAVLAMLEERWLEPRVHDKLSQWFWCGVLGELYGGAVETRIANDLEDLLAWIGGEGETPRTVYEAAFQPNRLLTLRSRLSAAYKGLNVLVQREGARDFFWKARIQELDLEEIALDIHHIFPKAWCAANDIKPAVYDSIINKTAISYKANRMIGGKAPSSYLKSVQEHAQVQMDDEAMNAILKSHFIDPQSMRADDFERFFAERQQRLLAIVARAMGKQADSNVPVLDDEEDFECEETEIAQ